MCLEVGHMHGCRPQGQMGGKRREVVRQPVQEERHEGRMAEDPADGE